MKGKRARGWLLAAIVALAAAGCTAGGGDDPGTPVVMSGVMLKGSVILNGVHFDVPPGTPITVDGSSASDANLHDGMVVTLKGTDHGNGSGTLEKLVSSDELQGQVQAVDAVAGTLQVLGQTIYVDDQTKYGNLPGGLAGLAVSDYVEVHGLRDSAGAIRATRIEALSGTPEVELKGIISNLTATTFAIGTFVVTYTGAAIEPSGTALADGMRVEAKLTGAVATVVRIEDLTRDRDLEPAEGSQVKIEGWVAGFSAAHPDTFQVNGTDVKTTASTELRNGSAADLRNDVRVEVEGTMSGGVLLAHELKFERPRIKIEGDVTARTDSTATVRGLVVNRTASTEGTWPAAPGRFRIEGYRAGSTLYADRVESAGTGDDVLQAPAEAAIGSPTYRLTLLGIDVDFPGLGVGYESDHGVTITRDQFFAAAAAGVLVKIKFDGSTTVPKEAELED